MKTKKCICGEATQVGSRANINKEVPENYSVYCPKCVRSVTTENEELTIKTWNRMSKLT